MLIRIDDVDQQVAADGAKFFAVTVGIAHDAVARRMVDTAIVQVSTGVESDDPVFMAKAKRQVDIKLDRFLDVVFVRHAENVAGRVLIKRATSLGEVIFDVLGNHLCERIVGLDHQFTCRHGKINDAALVKGRGIVRRKSLAFTGGDNDASHQRIIGTRRLGRILQAVGIRDADDLEQVADIRIARQRIGKLLSPAAVLRLPIANWFA